MRARGLSLITLTTTIALFGCGGAAIACFGCSNSGGAAGADGPGSTGGGGGTTSDGPASNTGGMGDTSGSSGSAGSNNTGGVGNAGGDNTGGVGNTGGSSGSAGNGAQGGIDQGGAGSGGTGSGGAGAGGVCEGDRNIYNDMAFDTLVAEGCRVLAGHLRLSNLSYHSLDGLETLRSIERELYIVNYPALESLEGLEGLTSIGEALTIQNTGLSTLSGLENITSIGGVLGIVLNNSLVSLSPLPDWPGDALNGEMSISFNPQLPACEVETLDASQVNASCTVAGCNNNDDTGTCP